MERISEFLCSTGRTFWKVGREDPRRVIHALKVGLAMTLVSLLYVLEPLFSSIGQNAMWTVLTVVVVLEFTAGATLCKGLNRGFGTFLAAALAFLLEFFANKSNRVLHAVFIGSAVFLIGTIITYIRFFPYIKKNCDHGVLIFMLTFHLIMVSSYRQTNILTLALQRTYTIAIGCGVCLAMGLLLFPNWSGEELHKCTINKLEHLAASIEACVNQYFHESTSEDAEERPLEDDPIYITVLDSKTIDETLALYARWEPRCSRHCLSFPWEQYVQIGAVLRHFGYTVVALQGCLQTEIQTPRNVLQMFKDPCKKLATEVSKVLRELASSMRHRRSCNPTILVDNLQKGLKELHTVLRSQPRLFLHPTTNPVPHGTDLSSLLQVKDNPAAASGRTMLRTLSRIALTSLEFADALPLAAFVSLLVELVARLDLVIQEVEELGRVARFEEGKSAEEIVVDVDNQTDHSQLPVNLPSETSCDF